jgi:ArsR family transcriptional regulator
MELNPIESAAPRARWELYRLLAEPSRLRLMALAGEEELAVGELAELLGEVQPTVSRHVAALRQAGVLAVRRQGTWTLVRLVSTVHDDAVLSDALRTGRVLVEKDGSLGRVAEVLRARESGTREFFARPGRNGAQPGPPSELAAYLAAFASLVNARGLAVDAGTGDGRLLEVLAPVYERVVAVDRSGAQLAIAAERVALRGFDNVDLVEDELDGATVLRKVRQRSPQGADAVFAARVLHHAPRPCDALRKIAALARSGGALVVIDYVRHEDEALRSQQADLWLGFEPAELRRLALEAGATEVKVTKIPGTWCGNGADRHVPWQVLTARMGRGTDARDDETKATTTRSAPSTRTKHGAKR